MWKLPFQILSLRLQTPWFSKPLILPRMKLWKKWRKKTFERYPNATLKLNDLKSSYLDFHKVSRCTCSNCNQPSPSLNQGWRPSRVRKIKGRYSSLLRAKKTRQFGALPNKPCPGEGSGKPTCRNFYGRWHWTPWIWVWYCIALAWSKNVRIWGVPTTQQVTWFILKWSLLSLPLNTNRFMSLVHHSS